MEYQKIVDLIDDASDPPSKVRKKTGLKKLMNQDENTMLMAKSNLQLQG